MFNVNTGQLHQELRQHAADAGLNPHIGGIHKSNPHHYEPSASFHGKRGIGAEGVCVTECGPMSVMAVDQGRARMA